MFEQPLEGAKRALAALRSSIQFNHELRNGLASGSISFPENFALYPPHDGWKKLDHAISVSQLYLIYESLIHECISEWLEILSFLVSYDKLPDKVRVTHRDGIGYILQNIEGRRFNSISVSVIVKEYQEALSSERTYKLHPDAFLLHDRNLRAEELRSILSGSGLTLDLMDWLKNHRLISAHDSYQIIECTTFDKAISSLIDRRNEASHATRQVTDILGEDVLVAYVDFLDALAIALVEYFLHNALSWQEKEGDWSPVGRVTSIISSNRKVCIAPVESCALSVGATVYLRGRHFCCRATIQELQIEGVSVESHTIALQPIELGIRLNIDAIKGAEIFVQTRLPQKTRSIIESFEDFGIQDSEINEMDALGSDSQQIGES